MPSNRKLRVSDEAHAPNRVKELRDARGLTQGQLADLCRQPDKMSKSTIARIETLESGCNIEQMRILAAALQVRPSQLLVDEDVELRVSEPARAALEKFNSAERSQVVEIAMLIGHLAQSIAPRAHQVSLAGPTHEITQLAAAWNGLPTAQRRSALNFLVSASELHSEHARPMAAE